MSYYYFCAVNNNSIKLPEYFTQLNDSHKKTERLSVSYNYDGSNYLIKNKCKRKRRSRKCNRKVLDEHSAGKRPTLN